MGQKVHPIGFRTGITEPWRSRWYAPKRMFGQLLVEDQRIRKFLKANYGFAAISQIEIERTREEVKVILYSARPGLLIGRKGSEVDKLREQLEELTDRRITVNIVEVAKAELSGQLVAEGVAQQLEKRASFRRVLRQALDATMGAGAKGVKIGWRAVWAGSKCTGPKWRAGAASRSRPSRATSITVSPKRDARTGSSA